jgi:hypothetical protein
MIEEFDTAWEPLLHKIAQLSTYIRSMGGNVPPISGPSGDDPMMLSVSHKKME